MSDATIAWDDNVSPAPANVIACMEDGEIMSLARTGLAKRFFRREGDRVRFGKIA